MIDQPVIAAPAPPVYNRIFRGFRAVKRFPVLPVLVLGVVLVAGIFAPWIAPQDPTKSDLRDRNLPGFWTGDETTMKLVVEEVEYGETFRQVSLTDAQEIRPDAALGDRMEVVTRRSVGSEYLLGTDHLGRDMLSRTIYGARISLIMAAVTLGVGGTIGVVLGLLAGWYGRLVDELIMRLVDIELSLPLILVALVLVVGPRTVSDHHNSGAGSLDLATLRTHGARRGVATQEHGLCSLGPRGWGITFAYHAGTPLTRHFEHVDRRCHVTGRYRHPSGSIAVFPGRRSASANAGLGIDDR